MKKQNKLKGSEGFDSYYAELYGARWTKLKECLYKPVSHAEFTYGSMKSYYLDSGSVICALCLPVKNAGKILDLCAAPGGKTLILSSNIMPDSSLYANERSKERKIRLSTVLKESLPEEINSQITVTCSDGALWCKREEELETFDSILLDAPCSSERHVLQDPKYLKEWSPSRIKTVSMEQWALLSSAWRLLKKGGFLMYSTCALAVLENDENIKKLLKKFDDARILEEREINACFLENLNSVRAKINAPEGFDFKAIFNSAEKTECGFHIVPDKSFGCGPLYFSLLTKN